MTHQIHTIKNTAHKDKYEEILCNYYELITYDTLDVGIKYDGLWSEGVTLAYWNTLDPWSGYDSYWCRVRVTYEDMEYLVPYIWNDMIKYEIELPSEFCVSYGSNKIYDPNLLHTEIWNSVKAEIKKESMTKDEIRKICGGKKNLYTLKQLINYRFPMVLTEKPVKFVDYMYDLRVFYEKR